MPHLLHVPTKKQKQNNQNYISVMTRFARDVQIEATLGSLPIFKNADFESQD